ncbi:MAG: hypothetical protein ACI8TQ_001388 [Planctomycetota bacterium]|jgi:hypothetical protein
MRNVLLARSTPESLTESRDSASFPGTNLTKIPLLMKQSNLATNY